MKFKVFFSVLFLNLLIILQVSAGDIKFKNETTKSLYVTVAYFIGNQWITEGWYELPPFNTRTLITNNHNKYVYWYAKVKGTGTDYAGESCFCTDPTNAFKKYDANNYCLSGERQPFNKLDVGDYDQFTFSITYESNCKGNCNDGFGTYFFDNGRYEGYYKQGQRSSGTYYWNSGDKYTGEFHNAVRQGEGTYFYKDGTSRSGIWENNEWRYHGRLHFILVVNTNNIRVGSNGEKVKAQLIDFYKEVAAKGKFEFNLKVIDGSSFSYDNVKTYIDNFKCSSLDVVVFHYFGHGGRKSGTQSPWPLMNLYVEWGSLDGFGLSLDYVRKKLYSQSAAKLGLFFADCCNYASGEIRTCDFGTPRFLDKNNEGLNATGIEKLFLGRKGYLMASSSSIGEKSSVLNGGSTLYTAALVDNMTAGFIAPNKGWTAVMEGISKAVLEETKNCSYQDTKQTPQYNIDSLYIAQ